MPPKEKTHRSKPYMKFVDSLPCCVYSYHDTFRAIPIDNEQCSGKGTHHHTETGGVGMKGSDLSCIPLCYGHHKGLTTAIHNGKETFARIYGIDIEKEVTRTNQAYIEYLEGKK